MCFSRAAFSLARLRSSRATIVRRRHSVPLLLTRSKNIWVGARRRFVENHGYERHLLNLGILGLYVSFIGLYYAITSDFDCILESKFKEVTAMLESKLDEQDREVNHNLDAVVDAELISSLDSIHKELKAKAGDQDRVNDNNSSKK